MPKGSIPLAAGLALIVFGTAPAPPTVRSSTAVEAARQKGETFRLQGRGEEAVKAYEEAVKLAKQEYGSDDERTLVLQNNLAITYQSFQRTADAVALFKKIVEGYEAKFGPKDARTYVALGQLGGGYCSAGRFAESESCLKRALKGLEETLGPDNEAVFPYLQNLSAMYSNTGRHAESLVLSKKLADGSEAKFGPKDVRTYRALRELGVGYVHVGRFAESETCLKRALKGLEEALGPNDKDVFRALQALSDMFFELGRYADCEPILRRLAQLSEAMNGLAHPDTVTVQAQIMTVLYWADRLDEAEAFGQRVVVGLEAKVGKDDLQTARMLNKVAWIKIIKGLLTEAELLLDRARAVFEAKVGPDAPETCQVIGNLGDVYRITGRLEKAEPLLRRALASTEARLGPRHFDTIEAKSRLGLLLRETGRFGEAETCMRGALKAAEETFGPEHRFSTIYRSNLELLEQAMGKAEADSGRLRLTRQEQEKAFGKGSLTSVYSRHNEATELVAAGRFVEAESLMKQNLESIRKLVGLDHPVAIGALKNLGVLYGKMHRNRESEECLRQALKLGDARFGADHQQTITSREELARVLLASDNLSEGLDLFESARRSRRRLLGRDLPALSEDDQAALMRTQYESAFNIALTYARPLADRPGVADRSASWVLNHKAVAFQTLAQRALLVRAAADPRVAPLVRDLTETRRRLAALATATVSEKTSVEGTRPEFDRLVTSEQNLSRQLGQALNRPVRDDPWVELNEVRAALPADAVLIEFARYEGETLTDPKTGKPLELPGGNTPIRYSAWVIPPTGRGKVRMVDLGGTGPIDEAVAMARRAIRPDPAVYRAEGEPGAEATLTPALETIARLTLGPLRPYIDPAARWVISPDSALWLVPWQALPLEGRYAVERHLMHLVVSGRDLASRRGTRSESAPVIFADPDFDLGCRTIVDKPAPADPLADEAAVVTRGLPLGASVARLEFTRAEADLITPHLARIAGSSPIVLKRGEATEAAFRALRRPSMLVLSTHGFFFANNATPAAGRSEDRLPENPLLRCGLLLAGFNHRGEAAAGDGLDGVVTGLEIVGADLQGTDLVVLSACETGLGEVQSGEGVAGLRQAFQLAGSNAVVATLWQIPDRESARLMGGFFAQLASGLGPASALRRAQLIEIAERRTRTGSAHPFFWSAFTLTGQPGASWRSESLGEGDDAPPPPAAVVVSSATPGPTRGLDPAPSDSAASPSTNASPVPSKREPLPSAFLPGTGPTERVNPFIEGTVLVITLVGSGALARRWWLKGA